MSEWVKTEVKLPSARNQWYLINTNGMVTMAFYERQGGVDFWMCHNDKNNSDEWDEVTHWMPLPELPIEL